jgi:Bacterial regulatory proteins, luxR family
MRSSGGDWTWCSAANLDLRVLIYAMHENEQCLALVISAKTVERHRANILEKLGMHEGPADPLRHPAWPYRPLNTAWVLATSR